MYKEKEFEWILAFIKEAEELADEEIVVNQVIALWTAFCLHNHVVVDTHDYDWRVMEIARAMGVEYKKLHEFDLILGQYLA